MIKKIKNKNFKELQTELKKLLRNYFDLRMQHASKKLKKTHLLRQTKLNIARIKTFLTEKRK